MMPWCMTVLHHDVLCETGAKYGDVMKCFTHSMMCLVWVPSMVYLSICYGYGIVMVCHYFHIGYC